MKQLMATAMQQGAMGMTTALIYPPSSYAKTDELIAMAKVAGRVWRTLREPHARRRQRGRSGRGRAHPDLRAGTSAR